MSKIRTLVEVAKALNCCTNHVVQVLLPMTPLEPTKVGRSFIFTDDDVKVLAAAADLRREQVRQVQREKIGAMNAARWRLREAPAAAPETPAPVDRSPIDAELIEALQEQVQALRDTVTAQNRALLVAIERQGRCIEMVAKDLGLEVPV